MSAASNEIEFSKQVRGALANLYDPAALRASGLCGVLADDEFGLRECLLRAIEAVKPAAQVDANARAWRAHRLLHLRYVEARNAVEVEGLLAMSTSQYYREQQAAIDAVVATLRRSAAGGGAEATNNPSAIRHNIPLRLTSFVGRQQEIEIVLDLIRRSRLVTLTGPGGCGKTRLALETADSALDDFRDGVWLVDLTALSEPGLLAQTVAYTLGIRELPGQPIIQQLVHGIGSRDLLLLLDNCEHMVAACAGLVTSLAERCSNLHVLMTSRETIGVNGEVVWQVPPLPVDSGADTTTGSVAAQLFVDRAGAIAPGFIVTVDNAGDIHQICARLDGLPLAIELAAARVRVLSPHQIAQRLDDRFALLTARVRSAVPHHQTLRALVDWSYSLLSDSERALFDRLSVFAGGCTLEAAQHVCSGHGVESSRVFDLLTALVDKSLVLAEPARDGTRYRMLETLRQYADERLTLSRARKRMFTRHGKYYVELGRRLREELFGPRQIQAIAQVELEHNNFRAVLSRAATDHETANAAVDVAASLGFFWFIANYFAEGRHWFDWVLSLEAVRGTPAEATILSMDGFLVASMGDRATAKRMCDTGVELACITADAAAVAWSFVARAAAHFISGDGIAMEKDARGAIDAAVTAGWRWGEATSTTYLGRSLLMQRRTGEAIDQLRVALERSHGVGDPFSAAMALSFYGVALGAAEQYAEAARCIAEALERFRGLGSNAHVSRCLVDLAIVRLRSGDLREAAIALLDGVAAATQLGRVPYRFAQLVLASAEVAYASGLPADAARLVAAAATLRRVSGIALAADRVDDEALLLTTLRNELGGADVDSLLAEGRDLHEEEALVLTRDVLKSVLHREVRVKVRQGQ